MLDMLFAECPRRIIPTISDGVLVSERLSCLRSSGPSVPKDLISRSMKRSVGSGQIAR